MNFKNDFEHVVHLFNDACEELDQQKARIAALESCLRDMNNARERLVHDFAEVSEEKGRYLWQDLHSHGQRAFDLLKTTVLLGGGAATLPGTREKENGG